MLERELAVARSAALEAGAIILAHYRDGLLQHERKADSTPVTRADLEANERIVRRLVEAFPGDGVLSEEGAPTPGERRWIVDPLDGTRDFLRRSGDFAVLIGLVVEGTPVLGVLHAPAHGVTAHAVRGEGAFCEGARLAVSSQTDLALFRGAVGRFALPENVRAFVAAAPFPMLRIGAGLKYLRLAESALEVALWLSGRERLWDTCAAEVIVREAGGVVTDIDGAELRYDPSHLAHDRGVVASNGRRHEDVLAICRPWFAA